MVGGNDWQVLSTHGYPVRALAGDYFRTSIGLILTAGPLFFLGLVDALKVILFLLSLVFLIFGFRTMIRQATTVVLCKQGIRTERAVTSRRLPMTGRATQIAWRDLRRMRLKYFTTRRDGEKGWMQLRLDGPGGRLSLDSAVEGFERIVEQALRAAGENSLELEATTRENLQAIGLVPVTRAAAGNTAEDLHTR